MSEHEFENWLSLLSGLLKLSPEQRNNISDELRSHLEERMEDLIDAGSSREEAIAAALEEFGDTAALAHHFTSIAHQKRRRLMRYTYGTIAAVTCAILVLATFWPQSQGPVMPNVIAQSQPENTKGPAASGLFELELAQKPVLSKQDQDKPHFDEYRAKIEVMMSVPLPEIEYIQMPLRDVIKDLGEKIGVTFFFEPSLLGNAIDPDIPIDIQAPKNTMSAKTLLNDFILKPNFGEEIGFAIRDNFVIITVVYDTTEVAVYNCGDLLSPGTAPGGMAGMMYGSEEMGGDYATMGDMYGSGGMGAVMPPPTASDQHLMRVIVNTVAPDTWLVAGKPVSEAGATGSIDAINGMIVIKHTRAVHEEVQELLKLLREAQRQVAKNR